MKITLSTGKELDLTQGEFNELFSMVAMPPAPNRPALTPADFEARFKAAEARDNWTYSYLVGVPRKRVVDADGSARFEVQQETFDAQEYEDVAASYKARTGEELSFERYWTKDDWNRYADDAVKPQGHSYLGYGRKYPSITLPAL